jgi:hypothetical protein
MLFLTPTKRPFLAQTNESHPGYATRNIMLQANAKNAKFFTVP